MDESKFANRRCWFGCDVIFECEEAGIRHYGLAHSLGYIPGFSQRLPDGTQYAIPGIYSGGSGRILDLFGTVVSGSEG